MLITRPTIPIPGVHLDPDLEILRAALDPTTPLNDETSFRSSASDEEEDLESQERLVEFALDVVRQHATFRFGDYEDDQFEHDDYGQEEEEQKQDEDGSFFHVVPDSVISISPKSPSERALPMAPGAKKTFDQAQVTISSVTTPTLQQLDNDAIPESEVDRDDPLNNDKNTTTTFQAGEVVAAVKDAVKTTQQSNDQAHLIVLPPASSGLDDNTSSKRKADLEVQVIDGPCASPTSSPVESKRVKVDLPPIQDDKMQVDDQLPSFPSLSPEEKSSEDFDEIPEWDAGSDLCLEELDCRVISDSCDPYDYERHYAYATKWWWPRSDLMVDQRSFGARLQASDAIEATCDIPGSWPKIEPWESGLLCLSDWGDDVIHVDQASSDEDVVDVEEKDVLMVDGETEPSHPGGPNLALIPVQDAATEVVNHQLTVQSQSPEIDVTPRRSTYNTSVSIVTMPSIIVQDQPDPQLHPQMREEKEMENVASAITAEIGPFSASVAPTPELPNSAQISADVDSTDTCAEVVKQAVTSTDPPLTSAENAGADDQIPQASAIDPAAIADVKLEADVPDATTSDKAKSNGNDNDDPEATDPPQLAATADHVATLPFDHTYLPRWLPSSKPTASTTSHISDVCDKEGGAPLTAARATSQLRLIFTPEAADSSKKTNRVFDIAYRSLTFYSHNEYGPPTMFPLSHCEGAAMVTAPTRLHIELDGLMGSGSLSDGYRGRLRIREGVYSKVVVKITCVTAIRYHERFENGKGRRQVLKEGKMYSGPLKPLYGKTVPHYYGLWYTTTRFDVRQRGDEMQERLTGPYLVYAMVLEDVGSGVREICDNYTTYDLPSVVKNAIVNLYGQLWIHGICHDSQSMKSVHVRCRQDMPQSKSSTEDETELTRRVVERTKVKQTVIEGKARMCLIDFEKATVEPPYSTLEREVTPPPDMWDLATWLGMSGEKVRSRILSMVKAANRQKEEDDRKEAEKKRVESNSNETLHDAVDLGLIPGGKSSESSGFSKENGKEKVDECLGSGTRDGSKKDEGVDGSAISKDMDGAVAKGEDDKGASALVGSDE